MLGLFSISFPSHEIHPSPPGHLGRLLLLSINCGHVWSSCHMELWTAKRLNFRTVRVVPCEQNTWTHGFSTGRKLVRCHVNVTYVASSYQNVHSVPNGGKMFWQARESTPSRVLCSFDNRENMQNEAVN